MYFMSVHHLQRTFSVLGVKSINCLRVLNESTSHYYCTVYVRIIQFVKLPISSHPSFGFPVLHVAAALPHDVLYQTDVKLYLFPHVAMTCITLSSLLCHV